MRLRPGSILLSCMFLVPLTTVSHATSDRSVRSLIAEYCIECHRVPGFVEEAPAPQLNAPDFQTIADAPETYTTSRLAAFLRQPHFPMRQLILSESDIQRVIAFIEALRSGPASAR